MPGSDLIQSVLNSNGSLDSFTLAFWNSNGFDCGVPDNTVLQNVTDKGGKITLSFGGAAGCASPTGINNSGGEPALAVAQQSGTAEQLMELYLQPITTYNIQSVDFDIENNYETDVLSYTLRNAAIALLQKKLNIKVSFTVPGNFDAVDMIKDALNQGVTIDTINLMCMDWGNSVDMVSASINCLQNAHNIFPNLNFGYIPLIGKDDQGINTYTLQNHKDVISQIQNQKMTYITLFSYWCLNIDPNNSYLQAYSVLM